MSSPQIRPGNEADIPALVALEQGFPPQDRFPVRTWRRLLRGNARAYVAVSDEEIIGAAVYLFRAGSTVARLYSLSVSPAHRGRGIGTALLSAGERDARSAGCDRIRLEVRQSNVTAIRLYEHHGFRVLALSQSYYPDGETAVRMEKPILPEASPDT